MSNIVDLNKYKRRKKIEARLSHIDDYDIRSQIADSIMNVILSEDLGSEYLEYRFEL